MLTLKLKELKQCAEAIDVTDYSDQILEELKKREGYFQTIGVSIGQCGTTGFLFIGARTKQLYKCFNGSNRYKLSL